MVLWFSQGRGRCIRHLLLGRRSDESQGRAHGPDPHTEPLMRGLLESCGSWSHHSCSLVPKRGFSLQLDELGPDSSWRTQHVSGQVAGGEPSSHWK